MVDLLYSVIFKPPSLYHVYDHDRVPYQQGFWGEVALIRVDLAERTTCATRFIRLFATECGIHGIVIIDRFPVGQLLCKRISILLPRCHWSSLKEEGTSNDSLEHRLNELPLGYIGSRNNPTYQVVVTRCGSPLSGSLWISLRSLRAKPAKGSLLYRKRVVRLSVRSIIGRCLSHDQSSVCQFTLSFLQCPQWCRIPWHEKRSRNEHVVSSCRSRSLSTELFRTFEGVWPS